MYNLFIGTLKKARTWLCEKCNICVIAYLFVP